MTNWPNADWATSGLVMLAEIIAEHRNESGYLTSNDGAEPFENETFAMRAYCWCDYENPEHEDGCPPNFEYKPTGVRFVWYKHAGRGIECNKPEPSMIRWFEVLADCVRSVKGAHDAAD
ncbi:hypothetical protein Pan2_64 [Pseudanabaena phage Pan2]|nr:hypothetical protein Pan2_64 [Pseudanabaena phage Pan2]